MEYCGCFEKEAITAEGKRTPKLAHLWQLVGNTPLIEIAYRYKGECGRVYAKCEHYNLTGSIKDRMALYVLQKGYETGELKPGDTIVEATSGNTGIAIAAIGRALGHPVKILMPDWLSRERMDIIRSMGAEVILVSKEEGGFLGSIRRAEELAKEGEVFLPRQFENRYNAEAHYYTTGREISEQLDGVGLEVGAFVAGVGTGGTVMGVGTCLRARYPYVRVHPLEPAESPTLSRGRKVGTHRIQGISDEFVPPIVDLDRLDYVVQASDGDAILMAQQLASRLGLGVGISSGANLVGAIKLKEGLLPDAVVVTVLSDDNKKYLSTDLMRKEPVREGYVSGQVELVDYRAVYRPGTPAMALLRL